MKDPDSYLTISKPAEGLYKEKGSKFIAKVFHVGDTNMCREIIRQVKKEYHDARHHCYAYRLGPENERYRSNDDGEPSGTAGKPILNQIYSHELFNVLVVVVRYFGGTKLGVSGLINAYKSATLDAISNAIQVKKYLTSIFSITFGYPEMNKVMRVLREEKADIRTQDFGDGCVIKIEIKKNNVPKTISRLQKIKDLKINQL